MATNNNKRSFFSRVFTREQPLPAIKKRNWDAAKNSRFFSKFIADAYSFFDDEIAKDIATLRSRARDAAKNDPHVVRYLSVIKEKVLGPKGITLRMAVRNPSTKLPDAFANNAIQTAWSDYSKAVTVDGLNLVQTSAMFLETAARDGEIFARIHRGRSFGKYGIQLQLLDAEYLDHKFNGTLKNGNTIVQGVEYDDLYRRIAYHFFKERPRSQTALQKNKTIERIRIPAEDVIHGFKRERPSQTRGFPWFAASIESLEQIKEYKKTELFASRIASAKQAFITSTNREDTMPGDDDPNDDQVTIFEGAPGEFPVLPPGMSIESWDPSHPHGNFGAFLKANLRGFAADVGLSYNTLANDAESTSYSSLRQHTIDEWVTYKNIQEWIIQTLLNRLFEEWLGMAFDMRLLTLQGKVESYNEPHWRCPVWAWLDPAKETAAITMQLDQKIKSRSEVARSIGLEYKDVLDEIADENAYAASVGVDLGTPAATRAFAEKIVEQALNEVDNPEKNEERDK